jgi:hypothetical protein
VQQRGRLTQKPVIPKERKQIIERYIEDEILLGEVYKTMNSVHGGSALPIPYILTI